MGVFQRPDSKFYWLWLRLPGRKGIRERTNVLAHPEHREFAERVYRDRMMQLAEAAHGASHRLYRPRADGTGWTYIYFVSDGELVKIGRAVNIVARLRAMQTSHPKPLTVLATMLAHVKFEGIIQQKFRYLRVTREWFRPDADMNDFIQRVHRGEDVVSDLAAPFPVHSRSEKQVA
jgi:hypothetical protein